VIALGLPVLFCAVAVQTSAADSLRALAGQLSDNALVVEIRARPLAVRDAVADALRRSDTVAARRLAGAYAEAWDDAFLSREVARFVAWPAERRAAKVWVDSVRRAGIAAYSRDGPASAVRMWRRALARATTNGDSAGQAALAGNIGAGLLAEGQLDSASAWLESARSLAAELGDARVEANALGTFAVVAEDRGDWARARELYAQALVLRQRIGDSRGVAADYNNLGLLAQRLGDPEEARRHFEAALALNRRDGRDEVAATNLLNLAGLASASGDFGQADAQYRDALTIWTASEEWANAATAWHGLGQVNLRRGDYPAAQDALRQALSLYERTGPIAAELAVRRDLAGALAAAGNLQGARDELARAQRRADSTRAPPGARAGITLARADLAVQLNALADAQRLYARAEALYRLAVEPAGEANAQEGRGLLLLARDDAVRAQQLIEAALRTELGAGDLRGAGLTRISLAQALLARGDTAAARRQLARATAELERIGDPVAAAAATGELAALEARAGKVAAAKSLYRAGIARLGDRVAPEVSWRLHAGWAGVLRSSRAADSAARQLRIALAVLEGPAHSLALPERRSSFLADKWDVYAQLAMVERDRGRPGAAFAASESMRAREMLELLDRGRVATTATGADLVAREQDLRRHIVELTRETESENGAVEELRGSDAMSRGTLLRAQEAYAELLLEMREAAPRHVGLVAPEAREWRDVARRLAPYAAFIEYLVSDSEAVAFVITTDTLAVVDLGTRRRDVARLIEFTRGTLERRSGIDSLWRGPLRQLYQRLVAPVEDAGFLSDKTRLVIVPHGELNYLPFAALIDGEGRGRFLIERFEVDMTPSASVWLALSERRREAATGGVLAFAPSSGSLPGSRQEVAAIGRLGWAGVRVLSGSQAGEDVFRRDAPTSRVIHLATYGVLNKSNPLFSYVELSPGGSEDGRLEVHEVFGLSLAADLVVLSACQTGLGSGALADVPAGDEWVGLTRAFLHAGAGHVVATLWPVDDWGTAALIEQFYGAGNVTADPGHALAAAQRALLTSPATAHPFYWAGFVSVGGAP
jgi:CHAT domain-containing protein/tetratricopeptide (TPR) repeat protein